MKEKIYIPRLFSFTVAVLCTIIFIVCIPAAGWSIEVAGEGKKIRLFVKEENSTSILWFHNAGHNGPELLTGFLSQSIATHILILFSNMSDTPLQRQKNAWEAVRMCKARKIPVIWCRGLWPSYDRKFPKSRLFDASYYAETIDGIRAEANLLGAEFTAVDTEAYGYFPFKKKLRDSPLSRQDYLKMSYAVRMAVEAKGRLDFVLPAKSNRENHAYNALVQLGKKKIAEHTYYNIPFLHHDKRRPYDIFGAYISISTENRRYPDRPFFTAGEILKRRDLWGEKGLMLYPKEDEIAEVIQAFKKESVRFTD